MTDKQKIELADLIIGFIKDNEPSKSVNPVCIGTLNTKQGFNGFKPIEIGTLVFDDGQRYFMMIESLDGNVCAKIPYYKETLAPLINFYD